jgi:hypothetical protein
MPAFSISSERIMPLPVPPPHLTFSNNNDGNAVFPPGKSAERRRREEVHSLHLISSEAAEQHANAPSRDESEPCADYGDASDLEEPVNLNQAVMSPTSDALSPFSPIEADEHSSPEQISRAAANLADMMPIGLTTKSHYEIETKISVWQYIDCSLPDGFKRIDLLLPSMRRPCSAMRAHCQ